MGRHLRVGRQVVADAALQRRRRRAAMNEVTDGVHVAGARL
jgi:predicted kinase